MNLIRNSHTRRVTSNSNSNCCVFGCKAVNKKNPELTFHKFPTPNQNVRYEDAFGNKSLVNRKKVWELKLKMNKPASLYMRVCSRHFQNTDYLTPNNGCYSKRILKKIAIPTRNLPSGSLSNNSRQKKKQKEDRQIKEKPVSEVTIDLSNMSDSLPKIEHFFDCANTIEPLTCFQCINFKTQNLANLKNHIKAGHTLLELEETIYKCENCNFQTYSRYLFLRHQLYVQCLEDVKVKSEPGETRKPQFRKKNYFDDCYLLKSFGNNHGGKRRRSDKIKFHKCKFCPYKSKDASASNLKRHILSKHTDQNNIRWFECAQCSYKSKTKGNLKSHIETTHSNTKFLKCNHCGFETKYQRTLKRHILTTHTEVEEIQWFECAQCSYKSRRKDHLKSHVVYKHDINYLKCDQCPFETKFNYDLKKHIHRKHGKNTTPVI